MTKRKRYSRELKLKILSKVRIGQSLIDVGSWPECGRQTGEDLRLSAGTVI